MTQNTFIDTHAVIITTMMFLMFGACIAYTVYVMWLDLQESRTEATCHDCEGTGRVERDPDWGMVSSETCAWCAGTGKVR